MDAEPLDELDDHWLVRKARLCAKGYARAGSEAEQIFMGEFFDSASRRHVAILKAAIANAQGSKN